MTQPAVQALQEAMGSGLLYLDTQERLRRSQDYFWYSPILEERLKDKMADVVAVPSSEEEAVRLLSVAFQQRIPVTIRGAGTGNYGQAVPLSGGMVLDTTALSRVLEIGEGYARVEGGVRLGALERRARSLGQELAIYPSTYMRSTAAGFVCGGSGGIGSVDWGSLWDGNVLGVIAWSMEEEPRRIESYGEAVRPFIHFYGTTGLITQVILRLVPRVEWEQWIASFPNLHLASAFAQTLCEKSSVKKRLVSVNEWPIPSLFEPIVSLCQEGQSNVLLEIEEDGRPTLEALVADSGGSLYRYAVASEYHRGIGLSEFTWNHTTLWAKKKDPTWTYLQASFVPEYLHEQIDAVKTRFGGDVLLHFEWIRDGSRFIPQSLPLVRFRDPSQLYEVIEFFESNQISIADPHLWVVNPGYRGMRGVDFEEIRRIKAQNDPANLLNPGKLLV